MSKLQNSKKQGTFQAIKLFIDCYFRKSGVHGFSYLGRAWLTWFEKLFWFILVTICIFFCIKIALQSVDRYYTKSTVVSLERDYYSWNTTLPALTVCPMQRLDPNLLDAYCSVHGIEGQRKTEFFLFMEQLANSTYTNFDKIPILSTIDDTLADLGINAEDYMQLIYNLTLDSSRDKNEKNRVRCFDGNYYVNVQHILTEFGLCYMANSFLSNKYSAHYLIFGAYNTQHNLYNKTRQVVQGTVFNRDVRLSLVGFKTFAIDAYIHSAFDIMKVDHNFGYTQEGVEYDPLSMEITTDDDFENSNQIRLEQCDFDDRGLKLLKIYLQSAPFGVHNYKHSKYIILFEVTVSQRKCRFNHESNLTHFPIYTRNLCLQECRLNLAYEFCKCIPHFYPNKIASPKPVCDYKQLKSCFPIYADNLLKLYRGNKTYVNCNCLPNCQEAVVGIKDAFLMRGANDLLGGIGASISMKNWPQLRLKRQVIYSFTDLLVSIGGTAGLFLGFCVLAAVELIYFFTFRLCCHRLGYKI